MQKPSTVRQKIALALIVLLGFVMVFVAYDNIHFHVRSTTPNLDSVATSSVEMTYHFSQPVKSVKKVTVNNQDVSTEVVVEDRAITIPLPRLNDETTYSISLSDIQSQWFSGRIAEHSATFTPKYVEFSALPEEQQKTQINDSNSGQVDDAFIDNNQFPIFNERWQLEATVINSQRIAVLEVKFFAEVPDYDNGGKITQLPNDTAEKYRKEVLREIEKRGGDPDKYRIIYQTNTYLYDKYSSDGATHADD